MKYTLAVVGDSGCGKSTWIWRYISGKFDQDINVNGIDTRNKDIILDNVKVNVNIRDTGGQERYRTMTTTHYRNVQGVILIFDITNPKSFNSIGAGWYNEAQTYASKYTLKVLIGNKSDLSSARQVPYETGKTFAEEMRMEYFETSSVTGENISEVVQYMIRELKGRGPAD
uniref:Uncharacterized protein n=1 Tax=Arcella intermedia TaxID=1963864 RepID=A0A6B2LLK4_9EUKA